MRKMQNANKKIAETNTNQYNKIFFHQDLPLIFVSLCQKKRRPTNKLQIPKTNKLIWLKPR